MKSLGERYRDREKVDSPSSPVKMLPADADIMRWLAEISPFEGDACAGGTESFPAVAAIVEGSSKCDVHNASAEESISGRFRRWGPGPAGECVEDEISSPTDIRSEKADRAINRGWGVKTEMGRDRDRKQKGASPGSFSGIGGWRRSEDGGDKPGCSDTLLP